MRFINKHKCLTTLLIAFALTAFVYVDVMAKSRSFSSSRSSSRSYSSSKSKSYSSSKSKSYSSSKKQSSAWKATSSKNTKPKTNYNNFWSSKKPSKKPTKKAVAGKPKSSKSVASKKKGFGGTSLYDKKAAKQLRVQKASAAKKAAKAHNKQFKKSSKTPVKYTAKTLPKSTAKSPLFRKTKVRSTDNYNTYKQKRKKFYRSHNWNPPTYVYAGSPSYGMWDGMVLWMAMDNINDMQYANMMYNHSNSDGYKQWREEADELAADNAELKASLAAMDNKLSTMTGAKDETYLPPGMDPAVALSTATLSAAAKEAVPFKISTGNKAYNYARFGHLLAREAKDTIAVNVLYSNGSTDNVKAYIAGATDGFVTQSDALDMFALTYPDKVAKMQAKSITLYKEAVQFIANTRSGIKHVKDMDKHTVLYIGSSGSGVDTTWKRLRMQDARHYGKIKTRNMSYRNPNKVLDVLSKNENAVIMFVSGLNSELLKYAEQRAAKDGFRLVNGVDSDFLNATSTDGMALYSRATIPSGKYPNLQKGWLFSKDIEVLAVDALFIVNDDWVRKYGNSAMTDMTAAVLSAQPYIARSVNGLDI